MSDRSPTAADPGVKVRPSTDALTDLYGEIGLAAVAAALRLRHAKPYRGHDPAASPRDKPAVLRVPDAA